MPPRCVERRTFGQKQFACPVEGCAAIVRQRTLHERKTWDDHLFEKGVDWRARFAASHVSRTVVEVWHEDGSRIGDEEWEEHLTAHLANASVRSAWP